MNFNNFIQRGHLSAVFDLLEFVGYLKTKHRHLAFKEYFFALFYFLFLYKTILSNVIY